MEENVFYSTPEYKIVLEYQKQAEKMHEEITQMLIKHLRSVLSAAANTVAICCNDNCSHRGSKCIKTMDGVKYYKCKKNKTKIEEHTQFSYFQQCNDIERKQTTEW